MNPCCNKLYAWPHFLTYIFNLHAYCTTPKWDTEGNNVMCDSSSRQSGAQLWWPLSLTSSWAQFISLSARLIWSMSPHCWHNSSSTAMQYVRKCQYSLSAFLHNWQKEQSLQISNSFSRENMLFSLSMFLSAVSCEYFSAPPAPQEIPELHWSGPESWNLPSQVVCQDKSFLPPAHSRWAGVESTQSLASSCESRQRYCQSSCWH